MIVARRHHDHRSRIRPAQLRPSRARIWLVAVAGLFGAATIGTSLLGRSTDASIELDQTGPWQIVSSSGPLEITSGAEPRLDYRASWLGSGPDIDATVGQLGEISIGADGAGPFAPEHFGRPRTTVRLSCQTRLPCRTIATARLPADAVLQATATDGSVLVERFTGMLAIETTDDHEVVLGPVEGGVHVSTDRGPITGHGLAATDVDIRTAGGSVDLGFNNRPRSVTVSAGEQPVTILLPPGCYAVTVVGNPSAIIEVDRDETAESRIRIDGDGPIRVATAASPARPAP